MTCAPEVFSQMAGADIYELDTTYRLGQETVDAIAPLYDFPFTSFRPDRYLTDENGDRVSEIVPMEVAQIEKFDALETMVAVAEYAASLVGVELVEFDADGTELRRGLLPRDIVVVVAHNAQVTSITAVLKSLGADKTHVGTANIMHGGQRHAVVALDPCIGYTMAGTHQLAPGRLCVMSSRNQTHMIRVHDGGWEDALTSPDIDQDEVRLGIKVRRALTAE